MERKKKKKVKGERQRMNKKRGGVLERRGGSGEELTIMPLMDACETLIGEIWILLNTYQSEW